MVRFGPETQPSRMKRKYWLTTQSGRSMVAGMTPRMRCSIAALVTTLFPLALAAQPSVPSPSPARSESAELSAESIPLVYAVEHTGGDFAAPPLPTLEQLPTVRPLTDPFEWSDGSGRSTAFSDWKRRRAEIKAEIEHYEIGPKPRRPNKITASFSEGTLTVDVTENGETLTLTSPVTLPSGEGPFPAVIGIGRGSGSLPSDIFSSRNIARIAYNFGQVMAHTQTRGNEPINRLYPGLTHMGAYSAWSWGVSRLIDGLELVQDDLPIDLEHLAVTGCSFAGKMALFAGAFDERIALTIAQEPGGGGAAAWRVSETLGNVEKLGATSHAWFMESMFQFSGGNVSKLPMDHHELLAMVAPRALLVLGNPDYQWLAEESGYISCRAAHEVWKTLGIPDRFGFSIVAGHPHCRLPDSQRPEVEAFVDKFLLGNATANTAVTTHPYPSTDYGRWIRWWGESEPVFPGADDAYTITLEPECATVGTNWKVATDSLASNGSYTTPKPGTQSLEDAPTGAANQVTIPLSLEKDGDFTLFARLDCPTPDDDSCWVKFDDGEFTQRNGLGTRGWQWITLGNFALKAGPHNLTIGLREDGLKLDKVCLSTFFFAPDGMGPRAQNGCP